ncbi:YkgJ family cysteine cluster protein [Candidatus Bathyarchaeota archaeon]|nr:YkgJ family cysteine cluster protein [Candidatus Bathyarchaeota archaeon]
MLLSAKDIERLERKGYDRDFFMRFDSEGYATLRNYRGFCVFYNAEKRCCKVRAHRPLGCRIYPVIYDENKGIVVDTICPSRGSVTEKQKAKRGEKVLRLLETIDAEAKKRRLAETMRKRS